MSNSKQQTFPPKVSENKCTSHLFNSQELSAQINPPSCTDVLVVFGLRLMPGLAALD